MANSNIKYYILPLIQGLQIYQKKSNKRLALVVGMLPWKNVVADWILEDKHIQIQRHFTKKYFYTLLLPFIKYADPVIYIWGYKAPDFFIDYVRKHNLDIFFLEDGFIRSTPDDDSNTPPLSIVMDSQAPYFDTTRPNDLTDLIANFDFEQPRYDESLTQELLDYYLLHRISKYNHQPYIDVRPIYGQKTGKRILILGQVPNDDSIKYGSGTDITLLGVTQRAIQENPNAQIIVKPHPMTLEDTNLLNTLHSLNCLVLTQPIHLIDALETIDHVYTITSLGGFEALLRGKKVTTLGRPFYFNRCLETNNTTKRYALFYLAYYMYCSITD